MFSFSNKKYKDMRPKQRPAPKPKLDRSNAVKNIDYPLSDSPEPETTVRETAAAVEFYSNQTSFRIGGRIEGEVDLICRSLGLSGPEDFAIPSAAWEASRAHLSSSVDLRSPRRLSQISEPAVALIDDPDLLKKNRCGDGGGIKGVRPPTLTPPMVSRSGANHPGKMGSNWEEEEVGDREEEDVTPTSNDEDDTSSTATEMMFVISPNGRFKRNITCWMRGQLLGSGSFGTVYEGISDDGRFFAVKEVSLLDQGSNAQQCIHQLEQEIQLLSMFEHENIVQYIGTDKEEAKLFIFLELVTQGSLASLYQKYRLRYSQVSAYTRQIFEGSILSS